MCACVLNNNCQEKKNLPGCTCLGICVIQCLSWQVRKKDIPATAKLDPKVRGNQSTILSLSMPYKLTVSASVEPSPCILNHTLAQR